MIKKIEAGSDTNIATPAFHFRTRPADAPDGLALQCNAIMSSPISHNHPKPDQVLADIADYVVSRPIPNSLAYETARHCLMDSLGCAMEALAYPACTTLLGPLVPGTTVVNGARVPGTQFELDPVQAAFNIGAMIRWLDFNDTWLAAEWGHPSDNLGGILAVADWLARNTAISGNRPLVMRDVLIAMIKAYEIQGCLALENSFNHVGLDHVVLVKVASAAVVTPTTIRNGLRRPAGWRRSRRRGRRAKPRESRAALRR